MIGKITTDISQSSIGMLSAKQIGMETRFVNFDLNALLGSFDDVVAAVPERGGNRSSDQGKGQKFIDQFVKAGGTGTAETATSNGARVSLPKQIHGQPNETDPEIVFDLSDTFSPPGGLSVIDDLLPAQTQKMSPMISEVQEELRSSESALENIAVVNAKIDAAKISLQAISPESDAKDVPAEVDKLIETPVRNPANLKFNEWENGFAATAPINDNFSAVESAIAKYSAREEQGTQPTEGASGLAKTDPQAIKPPATSEFIQDSPSLNDLQNPISQIDAHSGNGRAITGDDLANMVDEIDPMAPSKQPESLNFSGSAPQPLPKDGQPLDADNSRANISGGQKQKAPSAAVQPDVKMADLKNFNHAGNMNVRGDNPVEPSVPNDLEKSPPVAGPDKPLPVAPEIRSFQGPAAKAEQSPVSVNLPTDSQNMSAELNHKPAVIDQGQNDPIVTQKVDAAPVRNHSILGSDSQLSKPLVHGGVASEETAQISFHKNAPTPVEQSALTAADVRPVINQNPSTSISLKDNRNKVPVQGHAVKASAETSADADLPQSVSDKAPTIEIRPAATADAPIEPARIAGSTRLAAMFKRVMGMTTDLASDTKSVDGETAKIQSNKESNRLSEPSTMDVKNLTQQPKLMDSLYLRHGYKMDQGQSVAEASPITGASDSDLPEPQTIAKTPELPINAANISTQPITPAQILHPTAPLSTDKTTTFDWSAPRFAERFATEISSLSVNGDLKKFEINPKNLGRLEIALIARGTSEIVRIEAESQAARDVIVQHSQAIQEMLRAQGRSDLSIRVDVKETGFASNSDSDHQQLAQQDGTGTRDDRSNHQSENRPSIAPEVIPEIQTERDEGRYA